MLVDIGGGLRLEYGTARRWFALVKWVKEKTGRTLYLRNPYGAYRPWWMQQFLYTRYKLGRGKYPPAAKPGYSNHEDGKAFDIANYVGVEDEVKAVAKKLGLVRDKFEPWHWNNLNPNEQPPATSRKRNSMTTLYTTAKDTQTKGRMYALAGDGLGDAAWIRTSSKELATSWAKVHGNAVSLSTATFDSFSKRYTSALLGGGGASAQSIAGAVDAQLADNFDAIPGAVVDELTDRLS